VKNHQKGLSITELTASKVVEGPKMVKKQILILQIK